MFDAGSYTTSSAAPRAPPPTAPSKITNQVRGDTVSESGKNSEYLDHAPLGEQVGLSPVSYKSLSLSRPLHWSAIEC